MSSRRFVPRILQHPPLEADVQEIPVARIGLFLGDGDRDLPGLGIADQVLPALELPEPPGRDDLERRLKGHVGHLKSHLVIPLARGPVAHGIGAELPGRFHLPLGDQRPGQGRPQKIARFIDRIGPEGRPDIFLDELLPQVFHHHLCCAGGHGLVFDLLHLVALAHIRGKGHHGALVLLPQPLKDHRGVQTPGIGQHDFFHLISQIRLLLVPCLRSSVPKNGNLKC